MGVLYVTSNVPQAGRTALCCALAAILHQRKHRVALLKPLTAAGAQDRDAAFFTQINGAATAPGAWPRVLPPSGQISQEQLTAIQEAARQLASQADTVIVEGLPLSAGGSDLSNASHLLAEALDARVLAVVRYSPGLAPEMLQPLRDIFPRRLAGILLNQVTCYKGYDITVHLVPALEKAGLRVLGTVPEDRRMLAATVGQAVEHLEGHLLLGQEKKEGLVEHILIGGLVLESGVSYFERYENKAVLVRGDRPDIQMAALKTPTACLILTSGIEPTQYIRYEAQEEEVPLALVDAGTHQAASRLESLLQGVTVHHPSKVERFQQLLAAHGDLEALMTAVSG